MKQVGIYSLCFTISVLAFFVVGPINDVLLPELAALYDAGDRQAFADRFRGIQKFVLGVSVGAGVLQVLFPADVLGIVSSREFLAGAPALAVLGANGVFMAVVLLYSVVLNVRLKVWSFSWFWVITGAAIVLLDVLLLPRIGITGAAISQLVTSALGAAVLVGLNWDLFRMSFPMTWLLQIGAGCAAVLLVAVLWPHGPNFSVATALARLVTGSAAFLAGLAATGYLRSNDMKMFAAAIVRR
jgi:O-antigen/teichoic acid export membrane protein